MPVSNIPTPANVPTAEEHQIVAAVFNPRTLKPLRMMTPAPKNPHARDDLGCNPRGTGISGRQARQQHEQCGTG